ncbi:NAD(P)-binding protein [Trichoderma citrinoviride]|uniref:NAD(P)-binding protein n=1 Tax=Trichoderma citrinoviride TaxID=58853 RepID=A0A2T4B395_9HYPO|nr:NAD(P)-binding protein [Trichoderma citrinoviride]PTB63698.1 NAD(P)-binding protein [Trichoderma citrinoviride]
MAPTNKQWVSKLDGVDKLEMIEGEMPVPKDGEVLVKIHAVSINYRDIEVCEGKYSHHQTPSDSPSGVVICSDMCGTVLETTSPLLRAGTRVMSVYLQTHLRGALRQVDLESGLGFPLPGVLAEFRCFDARALVPVPEYLTDEEASCLPIAGVTAWMALNWMRPVGKAFQELDLYGQGGKKHDDEEEEEKKKKKKKEKETVLLQGTGGVSIAGLQIAKAAGLRTIITSSSDDKLEEAKKLGADHTINYRTYWEWQDQVLEATEGKGADYVLEVGGAKTLRKSFASVAFGGTISCIGYVSGKEDDTGAGDGKGEAAGWNRLNVNVLALRKNVTLKGLINGGKDRFEEMVRFYEDKKIRPVVCKVFGMGEGREALEYVKGGKHFGKVVVRVDKVDEE